MEYSLGEAALGTSVDLSGLSKGIQDAARISQSGFAQIGSTIGGVLKTALVAAAGGLIAAIGGIVKGVASNAEFERFKTQFSVLLGSTELAKKRLEELARFGATTPFELPEVVRADKILQSFGLHTQEAAKAFGASGTQIRRIAGDTAAGTGASFEEIALYLGKLSTGNIGEVIERFSELGITSRAELAKLGVAFSKSGELVSPLPKAMQAILQVMQNKFGGMMEAQSLTFEGMRSNLQDWIGATLRTISQPIFEILKDKLAALLAFLNDPKTQGTIEQFAQLLADGIGAAMTFLSHTAIPALRAAWIDLQPTLLKTLALLGDLVGWLQHQIPDAIAFLSRHWDAFKGALIAVGAVLMGAAVAGAIVSLAGLIASLANPITLIIGAVALLGAAWAENWGGIRTVLTTFWEQTGRPIFNQVRTWLQEQIPIAVRTTAEVWTNILKPALHAIWSFIDQSIIPILKTLANTSIALVKTEIQALSLVWTNVLEPALRVAWSFIDRSIIPILKTLANTSIALVKAEVHALSSLWTNTLKPALSTVWSFIDGSIIPVLKSLANTYIALVRTEVHLLSALWTNVLKPALSAVWSFITGSVVPTLQSLGNQHLAALRQSSQLLATLWTNVLKPAFSTVWSFITGSVIPTLQSLGNQHLSALRESSQLLATLWTSVLKPALSAVWAFITQSIIPALQSLGTQHLATLRQSSQNLATLWTNVLKPALSTVWSFITGSVVPTLQSLGTQHLATLRQSSQNLATLWTSVLKPALDAIVQGISGTLIPALGALRQAFDRVIGGMATIGETIVAGLKQGIANAWSGMMKWLTDKVNALPEPIKKALRISSPSRVFAEIGENIVAGLVAGMQETAGKLEGAVDGLTEGILGGMREMSEQSRAAAQRAVDQIGEGLLRKRGELTDIGKRIVGGLHQGAKSSWETMQRWFDGKIDEFTQRVKDALKIRSPSRVFAEIGESIVAGLVKGIRDSADQLRKAVAGLSEDVLRQIDDLVERASNILFDLERGRLSASASIHRQRFANLERLEDLRESDRLKNERDKIGKDLVDAKRELAKLQAEAEPDTERIARVEAAIAELDTAMAQLRALETHLESIATRTQQDFDAALRDANRIAETDREAAATFFDMRSRNITEIAELEKEFIEQALRGASGATLQHIREKIGALQGAHAEEEQLFRVTQRHAASAQRTLFMDMAKHLQDILSDSSLPAILDNQMVAQLTHWLSILRHLSAGGNPLEIRMPAMPGIGRIPGLAGAAAAGTTPSITDVRITLDDRGTAFLRQFIRVEVQQVLRDTGQATDTRSRTL